ncbi:MAG: thioredoxin family protein [Legionellaceae bacterium]|nr:thioredoxin family protein [Legionellaceae bacterium]
MAKTPSAMLPLGTLAPSFSLIDVVSEKQINLDKHAGKVATVIFFICNHCPYVKHIVDELPKLAHQYMPKGIQFIAINANDVTQYPDDSPENMKKLAMEYDFPFVYLFDETQEVAMAYQAKCTPDFFVFNNKLELVYRGQLDDARLGNTVEVTGESIRVALDALINNKAVPEDQKPSLGCSIKWKVV